MDHSLDEIELPRELAEKIKDLKTGNNIYTWGQIAQFICKEHKEIALHYFEILKEDYGVNQVGKDLCYKAAKSLGENLSDWENLNKK